MSLLTSLLLDLQVQYSNFKNALQQIAQKIGDVEQEADEHKYVLLAEDGSKRRVFEKENSA